MEVRAASECAHTALEDFLRRTSPRAASVHPDEELGPLSLCRLNKRFLYNSATSLLGISLLEMCPVAIGRHALECSQQDYSSWLKTGDDQKPLLVDCKKQPQFFVARPIKRQSILLLLNLGLFCDFLWPVGSGSNDVC